MISVARLNRHLETCVTGRIFAGLIIVLASNSCSKCGNDNVREVISPDGHYKMVLYRRSCGGTEPFLTNASILPTIALLQDEGGRVFMAEGDLAVDARWTDRQSVVLTVRGPGRVLKKAREYYSIAILFEFSDAPQ